MSAREELAAVLASCGLGDRTQAEVTGKFAAWLVIVDAAREWVEAGDRLRELVAATVGAKHRLPELYAAADRHTESIERLAALVRALSTSEPREEGTPR